MAQYTPHLVSTWSFPRDPRLYLRDHATFMRESFRETMREHHERHIPWHFLPFASAKYGYLKRSPMYVARKVRMGLGNVDNVFTGRTRDAVTTSRTITATQSRGRLVMRLPFEGGTGRFKNYGNGLTSQQKQVIARIEEIRAIASDEVQHLAEFFRNQYVKRVNLPGTPFRSRNRDSQGRFVKS